MVVPRMVESCSSQTADGGWQQSLWVDCGDCGSHDFCSTMSRHAQGEGGERQRRASEEEERWMDEEMGKINMEVVREKVARERKGRNGRSRGVLEGQERQSQIERQKR